MVGAYTITFLGIHALPGDPITNYFTANGTAVPASSIQVMKAYYGYDKPLWVEYVTQLAGMLHGNVGYSFVSGKPVITEVAQAIIPTLQLSLVALLMAIAIAVLIVTASALAPSVKVREAIASIPPFLSAIPTFWLGLVALQILSFRLRVMSIFPDGSTLSLLVPSLILGLYLAAALSQVMVRAIGSAQRLPFVAVLRARGASESWIYFRHLLKYCAGSAVTLLGLILGNLVAGAVIIETVFSRTGIGQVLLNAVTNSDLALVQGIVLLVAAAYVTVNLVVDLMYPLLDPRIILRVVVAKN
jgi:peptide/nickel transport system permease protein